MARAADPAKARAAAAAIVARLRRAGHQAYFAGGCVRDELLGLHPTDYDVATSAAPAAVRREFPRSHHVGEAFGVALVREGDATVEVATFRAEGPYSDKRRPDSVTQADAPEDAARRDFTINALFVDPLGQEEAFPWTPGPDGASRVIDFVGGLADLRARVLRAVGEPDRRLAEDHLRALRAARFAARLGFAIDPPTADAIRRHAAELEGVSRERIGEELRRMLQHPTRHAAATTLEALGLDRPVLRTGSATPDRPRLAGLPAAGVAFTTALAAWLLDRAGGRTGAVQQELGTLRAALCLSNEERAALGETLACHGAILSAWPLAGVAARKRLAARDEFAPALQILTAQNAGVASEVRECVADLAQTPSGLRPEPLVTGDDLISLGLSPGPIFRRLLDRLYDVQLEDGFATKAQGMELARTWSV